MTRVAGWFSALRWLDMGWSPAASRALRKPGSSESSAVPADLLALRWAEVNRPGPGEPSMSGEQLVVRCGVLCVRSQGYGDDLHGRIGIWVTSRPARPATDRQVISGPCRLGLGASPGVRGERYVCS